MYDTTVFGFERHAFLSKWLRLTDSHARLAIDSGGSIVGYTVARPTFIKESYKIGPLFADSEAVAEKLLKAVFEELLQQHDHATVVCIDAPTEKATKLCERLQGKRSFKLVYMVMNDLPDACFDQWFGYTTVQFGLAVSQLLVYLVIFTLTETPFRLTEALFRLTEVLFRLTGVTFRYFAITYQEYPTTNFD